MRILFVSLLMFAFHGALLCEAHANTETQIGEQRQDAARLSLNWNRSDIEKAHRILVNSASNLAEIGMFKDAAACLRDAASLKMLFGETAAALYHLSRAVKFERRAGNFDGVLETRAFIAYAHSVAGNTNESLEQINFVRAKIDSISSLNQKAQAALYIGQAYYAFEDLPNIYKFDKLAADSFRGSGNLLGESKAALELAYAYLGREELHLALEQVERARDLSALTGHKRGQALSYVALGLIQFKLGQIQLALNTLEHARSLFPLDFDFSERGVLLYNLGRVFQYIGDCKSSLSHFESSVELLDRDRNFAWLVGALWTLGEENSTCGQPDRARFYLDRSLKLSVKTGKPHSVIQSYAKMGDAFLAQGDLDKAEDYFRVALRKAEGTEYQWSKALAHLGLGTVYEKKGDLDGAEQAIKLALDVGKEISDKFLQADAMEALSAVLEDRGRTREALDAISEALNLTDSLAKDVSNMHLLVSYRAKIDGRNAKKINLLMNPDVIGTMKDAQQLALAAKEKSRAFALLGGLRLGATTSTISDESSSRAEEDRIRAELNKRADELTNLLAQGSSSPGTEGLDREINDLKVQLETIQDNQRQMSSVYAEVKDQLAFDLVDFQRSALTDNQILLEYSLGIEESYLWVVANNEISFFVLPTASAIDRRLDDLRALLEARTPRSGESHEQQEKRIAEADAEYAVAARELSNLILGPVAEKIKGKRLIVVPDGKLNYFPISALPMPNSESDDPILLTNEVIYQPSAQTYALLKKIGQERKDERTKDLLVFSDPVFNPSDERLTGVEVAAEKPDEQYRFRLVESFSSLSRLPASKTEAETVSNAVGGSEMFMGFDATRDRLLSTNLADYRVVHLATHGFLDPERPELSSLVFSRYDQAGKQIDESIRMHDIYSMKLNADLVVLSACQTGTGKEIKGEGVMGLNTAFLQAGARSVVSTLWQVEDNAANQLMKEFYGRMVSDGMSPSAALRAAQIKLYQDPQFRSPFFWAAFTVHGDAATATPFKRDHRLAIGISAAALLALIVFLSARRGRYRTSKV